jgi:putative membrane protein
MKTLILCIDRDNDFGEKAGIISPIVGREANLEAANALLLKDAEDSDANALFAGISTLDSLRRSGEDVEIATICGDKFVGEKADDILTRQLEIVLNEVKADQVIVISDGAEDEFIIPIVQSRIKIRSIKRVVVRQQQNIESVYYIIIKALKEEKFLKKVLIPIGVAFLVLGITILFVLILRVYLYGIGSLDPSTTGFMTVVSAIGIYLLGKSYSAGKRIAKAVDSVAQEFLNTRITVFSFLIAMSILGYGIYLGYEVTLVPGPPVMRIIQFIYRVVPFTIISIILFDMGRIVEGFTRYEKGRQRREILKAYLRSAAYSISFSTAVLGLLSFVNYAYQIGSGKGFYLILAVILTTVGTVSGITISFVSRKYGAKNEPEGEAATSQKDSRDV